MDWFYALNGQQQGPVTDSQLDDLQRTGKLAANTLVWRDGMAEWKPLSAARPNAAIPGSLPPLVHQPGSRCAECGHAYAETDMIVLNNSWVCATCKPTFLQRMMEGSAASGSLRLIWRKKREVVIGKDTPFPERCVCCNAATNGFKLKRDLSWHPPGWFVLLISPLIYIIVAMIVQKKAVVHIGLCDTHRAARKRAILIASLSALLGVILLVTSAFVENGFLALIGLILFIGGGIYGLMKAPIISATRIKNDIVSFKGAGQPFLDTLPEWSGPN